MQIQNVIADNTGDTERLDAINMLIEQETDYTAYLQETIKKLDQANLPAITELAIENTTHVMDFGTKIESVAFF